MGLSGDHMKTKRSVFQHISTSADGHSPKHFIEAQWALGGILVTLFNHQIQKIAFFNEFLKFSLISGFNVAQLFHRKERDNSLLKTQQYKCKQKYEEFWLHLEKKLGVSSQAFCQ